MEDVATQAPPDEATSALVAGAAADVDVGNNASETTLVDGGIVLAQIDAEATEPVEATEFAEATEAVFGIGCGDSGAGSGSGLGISTLNLTTPCSLKSSITG